MKTISALSCLMILCGIFFSCQKELSIVQGPTTNSAGILMHDVSGNCSSVTTNGIFKVGVLLTSTNYMDLSVTVFATGNYSITTDTLNGIYFSSGGLFTTTGNQTVRLLGHGTPTAAGVLAFTAHYDTLSSCAVPITVSPAGTTTALLTLNGAPGSCTTPTIQGTYTAGTILDPSNKIIVGVNVTGLGDYTLSTAVVNGISFSAAGTFTALGAQTVSLSGSGNPVAAGTNSMSITGNATSCNFPLTVNGPSGGPGTSIYLSAYYEIDTTLSAPGDTLYRFFYTYDAMNRLSTITEFDRKANGDTSYYALSVISYLGSDTLASRRIDYYKDFAPPASAHYDTIFTSFVNGRCILDSTAYSTGYYSERFAYSGNNIIRTVNFTQTGLPSMGHGGSTIYQSFVNGNNTYQIDTLASYIGNPNPTTTTYQKVDISTTYLPNPNPFYNAFKSIARPYYYDDIGNGSGDAPKVLMQQQNENMLIWGNGVGPNSSANQLNYTYTFRADGYPIESRNITTHNGTITDRIKSVYIYK